MCATNAGVTAFMQHVVRDVMLANILPDLLRTPVDDGINLHQLKFFVPLHFPCARPRRGLVATDARDPSAQFAELSPERLDLAKIAALIRLPFPECRTVDSFLLFRRDE